MAYQGYRLKINNTTLPNEYISRGTYKISKSPRVCDTYTDSLGITHEVYYPSTQTTITFNIKEHSTSEHSTLDAFFVTRSNVSVQYFDDNTEAYVTGTFKVEDFTWSHKNSLSNSIVYGATSITLREN